MIKPFLFDLVDKAYHSVMDQTPLYLQERSMGSAFVLGAAGTWGLTRLLQLSFDNALPKSFNQKYLLFIEKLGIISVIGIPLAYSFFDPRGVQQIMQEHPTYTSGMIGSGLGTIIANSQDILKKEDIKKNLI